MQFSSLKEISSGIITNIIIIHVNLIMFVITIHFAVIRHFACTMNIKKLYKPIIIKI